MTDITDIAPQPRLSWWARFKAFLADLCEPFDVEV